MSMCITINRPVKVKATPNYQDKPDPITGEYPPDYTWEDGKEYKWLGLSHIKSLSNHCKKSICLRKAHKLKNKYKDYLQFRSFNHYDTEVNMLFSDLDYDIAVDEIFYLQGWYMKKRFFNLYFTEYMTDDINQFWKYMYCNFDPKKDGAKEYWKALQKINDIWKPGDIIDIAW